MSEPVRAVIAGGDGAFAERLAAALGAPSAHVPAAALAEWAAPDDLRPSAHGIAWLHAVPSTTPDACETDPLAETSLLLRSARVASAFADVADVPLAFVALLPSPGMHLGAAGLACDLSLTATRSLMRSEIGTWSTSRRRIVGLVRAGLEGFEPAGQRPLEEIRRRTPATALGDFDGLADAIRFVASPRAGYLTGEFLRVDGGWNAYSWVYPTRTI